MKDYYKILGVDQAADDAQIKKAYHKKAKEFHPDTHPGDKECEAKFKEVNEAYQILGKPEKRKEYDEKINSSSETPRPHKTGPGSGCKRGATSGIKKSTKSSGNSGKSKPTAADINRAARRIFGV